MATMLTQRTSVPAGLLVLAALFALSPSWASDSAIGRATQATPFVIGQLTCSVLKETEADQSGAAQGRDVSCQFRPGTSGAEETYVGTLQGAGQIKALFERGTIMLLVKQIGSDEVMPGMLAQSYSAEAAARSGRSPPLVGDRNNTVILQPMIEQDAGDPAKKGSALDALIVTAEFKLQASSA